jgi:hypothetical protein
MAPNDPSNTDTDLPDRAVPDSMFRWVDASPKRKNAEKTYLKRILGVEKARASETRGYQKAFEAMAKAHTADPLTPTAWLLNKIDELNKKIYAEMKTLQTAFISALGGGVKMGGILSVDTGEGDYVLGYDPNFDDTADWYDIKGATVVIRPEFKPDLQCIALDYYFSTKTKLFITDGFRTPAQQAQKLIDKMDGGDNLAIYHAPGVPVLAKYKDDHSKKKTPDVILADITAIVQAQFDSGVYISKHLVSNAFDVRQGTTVLKLLKEAAASSNFKVLSEKFGTPHYHVQSSL